MNFPTKPRNIFHQTLSISRTTLENSGNSTRQRSSTLGTRHCATSRAGNAGVHSTGSLVSEQPWP